MTRRVIAGTVLAVSLFILGLLAFSQIGCSQQQLDQATADIQKLQTQYNATTQAVSAAQWPRQAEMPVENRESGRRMNHANQ